MRLKTNEIERFMAQCQKTGEAPCPVVLFYGPDEGLVRERSAALTRSLLGNEDDPFGRTEITENEYRTDPARLADEFGAVSMFGGKRVIRLRLEQDRYGKRIAGFLADLEGGYVKGEAVAIVEAGDLKPSSALRKAAENSQAAVAVPCYRDDTRTLREIVTKTITEADLQYTDDVVRLIVEFLGGDRALTRQELTKLVLYKKGLNDGPMVNGEDVYQAMASANILGLQEVAYAASCGEMDALHASLERCFLQAEQPVRILRALTRHMEQVHASLSLIESGEAPGTAIDVLRPKIHFQRRGAFEKQLKQWSVKRCESALHLLYEAEGQCKSTGFPAQSICAQTSFRIAKAARAAL